MTRYKIICSYVSALALIGSMSACKKTVSPTACVEMSDAIYATNSLADAATAAPISGAIDVACFTREDGTRMSKGEFNHIMRHFPMIRENYDQLKKAVRLDESSGIVTLWDKRGNVIATIPPTGYATVRSFQALAATSTDQGGCASGGALVFDVNDSFQPAAEQQGKQAPAIEGAGFHFVVTLSCEGEKK
jgi:hypothetical protein